MSRHREYVGSQLITGRVISNDTTGTSTTVTGVSTEERIETFSLERVLESKCPVVYRCPQSAVIIDRTEVGRDCRLRPQIRITHCINCLKGICLTHEGQGGACTSENTLWWSTEGC